MVVVKPTSLPAMVFQQAAARPDEVILRKKDRGIWKPVTWTKLLAEAGTLGAALNDAGVASGSVAGTLAAPRPESAYIDLAIIGAGGTSFAMDPDTDAAAVAKMLRRVDCTILFVENEEQLDKVLEIRSTCPALQRVVILDMKGLRDFSDAGFESLADFKARGRRSESQLAWREAAAAIEPDHACTLFFAAGADGPIRRLTHRESLEEIARARTVLNLRAGEERLAILSMADPMERLLGFYLALETLTVSNYLEGPETAVENLQELQPTVLAADAEIWRRMMARVEAAAARATRLQRTLYRWALAASERGGPIAALARALVLQPVRRELGLGRLKIAYVGQPPLSPEVARFATALGIVVKQVGTIATPAGEATTDLALHLAQRAAV